jgi:hypothetical protein
MRSRLVGDGDGLPMVVTFSTCVDSIRTIPFIQHDPDRLEDVLTDSEDHAGDEWLDAALRSWRHLLNRPKRSSIKAILQGRAPRSPLAGRRGSPCVNRHPDTKPTFWLRRRRSITCNLRIDLQLRSTPKPLVSSPLSIPKSSGGSC